MSRFTHGSLAGALTALAVASAAPVHAQDFDLSQVTCPRCEVSLTPVVELGDPSGPGMLEYEFNAVALDSRGRFYLVGTGSSYFWVFDDSGEVLRRVGREGRGPGEFTFISGILIDAADSVFVFDPTQLRMTVLSPEYELVRSETLEHNLTGRGTFQGPVMLLTQGIRTPERIGYPLHTVDRSGRVLSSFGAEGGPFDLARRMIVETRRVAPAADGTVWSARVNEYRIERWGADGQLLETLAREANWFPEWVVPETDARSPPTPILDSISLDGDTLWVMIVVPGTDWHAGVEPGADGPRVIDRDTYRHTIIEAIDLRTREVIVSTRFPAWLSSFIAPGLISDMDIDPSGNPIVTIRRLSIAEF